MFGEVFKLELPSRENKERFVREMFDSIAGKYDLLNTLMSLGMDAGWRQFAVKRAKVKSGDRVLDICCGTGKITMELARVVGKSGTVTGLDFSSSMLEVANRELEGFDLKDVITLVQGNAMDLPFPDHSFDAVTVGWGLRNVPDIEKVVREMMRVVKPGGMVVSLDMAKPEMVVFKQVYWLYFEKLVPLMGKIWARRKGAYSYLHQSAKEFLSQKELKDLFYRIGLKQADYHNLCCGVVAVVEGQKPQD